MKNLKYLLLFCATIFATSIFSQATGDINTPLLGSRLGVGGSGTAIARIQSGVGIDRVIIDKINTNTGTGYLSFNNIFSLKSTPGKWLRAGNGSYNGGAVITSTKRGDLQFFPVNTTGGNSDNITDVEMAKRMVLKVSHNNTSTSDGYIQVNDGYKAVHVGVGSGKSFDGNGYIGFNIQQDFASNSWKTGGDGSRNGSNVLYSTLDGSFVVSAMGSTGGGASSYNDTQIKDRAVMILDKNGLLKTKEVKVQTDIWADYVFADDYQLPTLEEVSTFIEKNNHLPGVPSQEEILADGIELGNMNVVLLEKIEELTLYLLEQDKQLKTQRAQIDLLQSKLEK